LLLDSSGHQDHPAGWEVRISDDGAVWSEPIASNAQEKAGRIQQFHRFDSGRRGANARFVRVANRALLSKVTLTKPLGWWWANQRFTVYNGGHASTKAPLPLPRLKF
jgi:hypothetical protein